MLNHSEMVLAPAGSKSYTHRTSTATLGPQRRVPFSSFRGGRGGRGQSPQSEINNALKIKSLDTPNYIDCRWRGGEVGESAGEHQSLTHT